MAASTTNPGQGSEDVARMQALLKEAGVAEYEPTIISQLLDVAYATTAQLLTGARAISQHCSKSSIDETDVQIAMEFSGALVDRTPDRVKILQMSAEKNSQPLPQIRHNFGLKLPNDRFCLLQPNMEWRPNDNPQQNIAPIVPRAEAAPIQQLRPEHVTNLLKRKHEEDFDS
ncbi:unnamed protein product [Auanema sp. JU1783]|nr:unnamed protein product [Auanema sp. JU1783]